MEQQWSGSLILQHQGLIFWHHTHLWSHLLGWKATLSIQNSPSCLELPCHARMLVALPPTWNRSILNGLHLTLLVVGRWNCWSMPPGPPHYDILACSLPWGQQQTKWAKEAINEFILANKRQGKSIHTSSLLPPCRNAASFAVLLFCFFNSLPTFSCLLLPFCFSLYQSPLRPQMKSTEPYLNFIFVTSHAIRWRPPSFQPSSPSSPLPTPSTPSAAPHPPSCQLRCHHRLRHLVKSSKYATIWLKLI